MRCGDWVGNRGLWLLFRRRSHNGPYRGVSCGSTGAACIFGFKACRRREQGAEKLGSASSRRRQEQLPKPFALQEAVPPPAVQGCPGPLSSWRWAGAVCGTGNTGDQDALACRR